MRKLEQWMLDNEGHPEMVQFICNRLRDWQSMKDTTNPPSSDSVLSLAITQQQWLGWFNFIQGYLSIQWRVCQSSHLITIKSKKSALLWMSRFQKRQFHIVWEMWSHRNKLLHGAGDKIHEDTLHSIDDDIRSEWERGLDKLPLRYAHLFSGSLAKNLQLIPNDKKRWLTSVWVARDKMNVGIKIWDRASVLNYDKWKARKNPQVQVNQASTLCRSLQQVQKLTIDTTHSSDSEDCFKL
jgi:hypothetical protein